MAAASRILHAVVESLEKHGSDPDSVAEVPAVGQLEVHHASSDEDVWVHGPMHDFALPAIEHVHESVECVGPGAAE